MEFNYCGISFITLAPGAALFASCCACDPNCLQDYVVTILYYADSCSNNYCFVINTYVAATKLGRGYCLGAVS
jgi:hypothetical protein